MIARVGARFNDVTPSNSSKDGKRSDLTTDGAESEFSVLKRGLIGVYHYASKKHLPRHVDESTFRLNVGNVKRHTVERISSMIDSTAGKRLTYKPLMQ